MKDIRVSITGFKPKLEGKYQGSFFPEEGILKLGLGE